MTINVMYLPDSSILFTYDDPAPIQFSILPVDKQIIEYNNKRYVVKQVVKKYESYNRYGKMIPHMTSIDIIVADDLTGKCW